MRLPKLDYAAAMNDNMDNDLNGHAQRAAFTYASKAIVDESWTQMDAFPEEDDDVASDYETEEEVGWLAPKHSRCSASLL